MLSLRKKDMQQKHVKHWSAFYLTKRTHDALSECNDTNLNSLRLLERLGFRREGHFLEDVWFKKDEIGNPIYVNSFYYAVLKSEWIKL